MMDMTLWMNYQAIGTVAFFAGVVLLLSSIFLSSSVLMCVIAIAGLSVLFGILLRFYRRERRRMRDNEDGGES